MAFRVGQKVVCVDDAWPRDNKADFPDIEFPVAGEVYTISWIDESPAYPGRVSCRVAELKSRPFYCDPVGMSFRPTRFRPVVERKTDISIFTALLTPNKRERADA